MKFIVLISILLKIVFADSGYYQNPFDSKPSSSPVNAIQKKPAVTEPMLQNKNNLTSEINVLKFGAVADGVTDNTDIFREALSKCRKLYIPKGVYLITNAINIPDGVEMIYGEGILKGTDTFGIFRQTHSINGLKIEGLTFDFQPPKDTMFGALYFDGGSYKIIEVNKCTFKGSDFKTNGILLVGKKPNIIDGFKITNSKFIDIKRAAIEILHRSSNPNDIDTVKNIVIENNHFSTKNIFENKVEFNPAISLSDRVNGAVIRNNFINGYRWGIETARTINTLIDGNTILNANDAINSSAGTIKSTIINNKFQSFNRLQLYDDSETVVKNNQIVGTFYILKSDRIVVQNNRIKSDTSKVTVWLDNSTNTVFSDNYIENNRPDMWDAIRGYGIKSDKSNKINNNKIYMKYGHVPQRNTDGASISIGNNIILQKPIEK